MDSSSGCKVQKISSVMNGMYGCSSFNALHQNRALMSTVPLPLVRIRLIVQTRLHHLDVPVAELLPDKVINLLNGDAELILIQVLGYFLCKRVYLGQNPLVRPGQSR